MKVVVTGAGGMLGREMARWLESHGHEAVALARAELDVTDPVAVREVLERERPGAVAHCAAYTDVDGAEREPRAAFAVNESGTRHVARVCAELGAHLVYPSTDYVFDGRATAPYPPDAPTAPLSAYGQSKLAGEEAAREAGRWTVVRTSWLYGEGGANFVDAMMRLGSRARTVKVVTDQVGRPTAVSHLAEVLGRLLLRGSVGTFHVSDGGPPVSRFGLASTIFALRGISIDLVPVDSDAFGTLAPRPRYSVLDCTTAEEAAGIRFPDWRISLADYIGGQPSPPAEARTT